MKKIAIIDDDEQTRESAGIDIEDLGLEPVMITGVALSKEELIDKVVKAKVDAVFSDHRLAPCNLSNCTGAEVLSDLYLMKYPSVLVTQFLDMEADVGIRKYRNNLPSVISRGSQSPDLIVKLLEASKYEIENGRPVNRQAHRAIIRVENFTTEDGCNVVDGIITNWSNNDAVRFPVDNVTSEVLNAIRSSNHTRLMAFVNTGGEDSQELFINDIQLAPNIQGLTLDDFC